MDEDILEAYVRSLAKSAEYRGKFINYVELRALIQRFKKLNPDADPKTVDWVGVWDERLEYSELLEAFRRNYPMYRWVEDSVTEEAFEDARKRRLERIVRELDEDSLRELSRLIREELGEAEAPQEAEKREARREAVVVQETLTPTPTQVQAPAITLKTLSRYPILPEAKQFLRAFELGEEVDSYAEAAKTRVLEAIERGEKGVLPREDPIGDLVTYALARVLCLAVGEPWLLRRWALAEAARMERYLHTEEEGLRRMLLRRILSIEDADDGMVGRIGDDSYRYMLSVPEYLRVSRGLDSPEWMLVNRMVAGGHVYLTTPEAIRLFRQRVYQLLSSMEDAPRVDVRQLPPRMQEAAMDVVRVLVRLRSAYEEPAAAPAPGDWPPCMAAIRARVAEAGHKELFSLAAFMINRGYTKEEILSVLASRPDYNERIARYQIEHIAGERGGGTRYRPPSCSTMRTYGLCIENGNLCPRSIRNPLEYRKPR
jgi:DNA primase large subunit